MIPGLFRVPVLVMSDLTVDTPAQVLAEVVWKEKSTGHLWIPVRKPSHPDRNISFIIVKIVRIVPENSMICTKCLGCCNKSSQECFGCVNKCGLKCLHKKCTRESFEEDQNVKCDMPYKNLLKCGHRFPGLCDELFLGCVPNEDKWWFL